MLKLKINLYAFNRENFTDEAHDLEHELGRHGNVVSKLTIGAFVAQFTFNSNLSIAELKSELHRAGFAETDGLSVNLYDDDLEKEGQ